MAWWGFFLALLPVAVRAQSPGGMPAGQADALSRAAQARANWFKDMPQFNRDSSVFYFGKAVALLEKAVPTPYGRLADVYRDITDRSNRSHTFVIVDSLAAKAWGCYDKIPPHQRDRRTGYDILNNWALIKVEKGEMKKALALYEQAYTLLQDDPSPEVQAKLLKDKGRFYSRYGLPEEQEAGYQAMRRSLRLYQNLETPQKTDALFQIYKIMSLYYSEKKQADSSDYCFSRLKNMLPQVRNPFHHNWYYMVQGTNFIGLKKYALARQYLQAGVELSVRYRLLDTDTYQYGINSLGFIAQEQGRYDEAVAYFEEARCLSLKNNFKGAAINALEMLAGIYEKKKDMGTSLAYHKLWAAENLAFEKGRSERSLREYDLQLDMLQQEKELEKKRAEQHLYTTMFTVAAVVAGLLAVILVGLYKNYTGKRRMNARLETLNHTLEQKNTQLDKRNAENELLLKEIHHRVKNNLEVVSSLLALQSARIDDPNVREAMQASQNRVHSMGILHQRLYQSEHLAFIEMREYFKSLGENILDSYNEAGRIHIDCPMPAMELDVDTAVPVGLIVNELLTNALKYAFPQGRRGGVSLSLTPAGTDMLQLRVADDGVGKAQHGTPQGTGFGTQLVALLIRQIEGTLQQEVRHGTEICIQFKKRKFA